jgi:iron(III) transport system ATP-binding protein
MNASEITLRNVRRLYDGAAALDDVSLTAPTGQVLALLGASGSGKSTILRLIAGLEPVDAGEIRIGDEVVSAPGRTLPAEARRIGMVFQDYALFPHLSVAANVGFGLNTLTRDAREAQAHAWLERVGLAHRAGAYPHELSGGEQQRVALARAMAPEPRAILLDEPFSGLDPELRAELRDVTLDAVRSSGATALFVTHDAEEALLVADRLAIIQSGRVLQEADPREAYDRPASPAAAAALGPVNQCTTIVANGAAPSPFGSVAAPGFTDGARVRVVVRAEALRVSQGSTAKVLGVRPHGAHDLVLLEAQGQTWRALIAERGFSGQGAEVSIDPAGAFVFAEND